MRQVRIVCVLALAGLVLAAPQAAWGKAGWLYSRTVSVPKMKHSGLAGSDVAVVTMPTGGLCRPDGKDLLVQTALGKDVPFRVLMMGPGDQARIAFACLPTVENYVVFLGNPNPPPPPPPLDIQRGVLLEMWEYPGGNAATLEQAQECVKKADKFIGRTFRPTVFLGHNPFGPQNRVVSVTTAWLNVKSTGSYKFALTSQDATFLLIDDKPLLAAPGWHGPHADIRNNKAHDLSPGLHKLTLYHVNANGDPLHTVGWQAPGDQRIWVIPAEAFAPVHQAVPGAMKKYGAALDIDFVYAHAGETFMDNHYLQRFRFEALKSGVGNVTWSWDFGDGQTSTAASPEHVYFMPGEYTVKLTAKGGAAPLERVNKIVVGRLWERVTAQEQDPLAMYGTIASTYDWSRHPSDGFKYVVELFKRLDRKPTVIAAVDALLAKSDVPPDVLNAVLGDYAEILAEQGETDKAVKAMLKASTLTKDISASAAALVRAGKICLLDKQKLAQAQDLFETVLKKYGALTTNPAIREARIGLGDVWRARGDLEKAAKAYETAGEGEEVTRGREPIIRGDLARHVEEYIRSGDLESAEEYLDRWEDTFPKDKLVGYWSLMRVRYLLARKKSMEAINEAEVLATVNPSSNYGAELLLLAADEYKAQGKAPLCRETLKKIVEKFPESPLASEAAKRLKE